VADASERISVPREVTLIRPSPLRAATALAWREIIRFVRQRNRIVGTLGTPFVFWLLFGTGLSSTFRMGPAGEGQNFLQYYFPGSLILILLFAAIFSSISIIEDRREGFLQSVLVAPIPRWSMVLGKVLGGASIAWLQGLIFLLLALTLKVDASALSLLGLALLVAVAAVGITGLGFVIAWRMDSTQGFHAVMNLVLMPMWLLSGAFFPIPAWRSSAGFSDFLLHGAMRLNPLTYAVAGARQLLYGTITPENFWQPSLVTCWAVTTLFAIATLALATWVAKQRTTGDLL
jgi:ABC-2 type transport system permease protein